MYMCKIRKGMVGNQHGNSLLTIIHITLRCLDPVRVDKGIYGPGQTLDLAGFFLDSHPCILFHSFLRQRFLS